MANFNDPFPHLEFWRSQDDTVFAVTKCQLSPKDPTTERFWAFYVKDGAPKVSVFNKNVLGLSTEPDPASYPSGAELIQALHPWSMWHKFLAQVKTRELYGEKLTFHLQYSKDKWLMKDAVSPNASMRDVTAVIVGSRAQSGKKMPWSLDVYSHLPTPGIVKIQIPEKWIRDATTEIDEKTARIVHPELFDYLDANFEK